jgi:hypothetical protein
MEIAPKPVQERDANSFIAKTVNSPSSAYFQTVNFTLKSEKKETSFISNQEASFSQSFHGSNKLQANL